MYGFFVLFVFHCVLTYSLQPTKGNPYNSSTDRDMYRSDESLLRKKLLAMGVTREEFDAEERAVEDSSVRSSTSTLMNNLNRCSSSDAGSLADNEAPCGGGKLSAPNIAASASPVCNSPDEDADSDSVPIRDYQGRVNRALVTSLQRSLPSLCSPTSSTQTSGGRDQASQLANNQGTNLRQGHAPYSASVGCTLDVLSNDVNSKRS